MIVIIISSFSSPRHSRCGKCQHGERQQTIRTRPLEGPASSQDGRSSDTRTGYASRDEQESFGTGEKLCSKSRPGSSIVHNNHNTTETTESSSSGSHRRNNENPRSFPSSGLHQVVALRGWCKQDGRTEGQADRQTDSCSDETDGQTASQPANSSSQQAQPEPETTELRNSLALTDSAKPKQARAQGKVRQPQARQGRKASKHPTTQASKQGKHQLATYLPSSDSALLAGQSSNDFNSKQDQQQHVRLYCYYTTAAASRSHTHTHTHTHTYIHTYTHKHTHSPPRGRSNQQSSHRCRGALHAPRSTTRPRYGGRLLGYYYSCSSYSFVCAGTPTQQAQAPWRHTHTHTHMRTHTPGSLHRRSTHRAPHTTPTLS